MGGDEFTLTEIEDNLYEIVKMPGSIEEIFTMKDELAVMPPYVMALKALFAAVAVFDSCEHACEGVDCNNPDCFGKPQHQAMMEGVFEETPRIREEADRMLKQVAFFIYQFQNCNCKGCQTKEKENAAPFN